MNPKVDREAKISCWGMMQRGNKIQGQEDICRKEIKRAVGKLKMGKTPGTDGIRAEMLKYGGDQIINILMRICQVAWEVGKVPQD